MFPIHHVFPQHFADHPVMRFLAERFDKDAIVNLMALPPKQWIAADLSSSPHTGGHLGTYYKGFCDYLKDVERSTGFKAALAGDASGRDEVVSDVNEFVAAAKYALANGHLFANTPTGVAPAEANEVNRKWFENWRRYALDNRAQIDQMRVTVDQLKNAGQPDAAVHWPLLSPTSDVSMEERIDIVRWHIKNLPISLHSTVVGPVPDLPGLVPSLVDTRLRGFSAPAFSGQNEPEGLARIDPRFAGGPPPSQVPSPSEQRLGQLPPSTAMTPPPQVLQFNNETGDLLKFSDGSPMMGPNPYNLPHDPADTPAVLRGMALFGATLAAPELLPFLPALSPILGLGLAGATASHAEPTDNLKGGSSATEASPSSLFNPNDGTSSGGGRPPGSRPATSEAAGNPFDQTSTDAGTFAGRFGNWTDTPGGTMPAQDVQLPTAPAAGTVVPEEVRRLTRVNAANAGSVFTSGSAPVPYLPSNEFNDRFGHWTTPTAYGQPPQTGRPIGTFADEPGYSVPPPIFGAYDPGNPSNSADEWFSQWIGPLLRP